VASSDLIGDREKSEARERPKIILVYVSL